jgi:ubiquitin C-terminal hydrolase
MFRLKWASFVTCGSCGHRSSPNPDCTYNLGIIPQRGVRGLSQNVQRHFAAELLDGYKCDACKQTPGNSKATEITSLPELLCVQLNSGTCNPNTGSADVNRRACQIPATLDLTTLLPRKQQRDAEGEPRKIEYELHSVVRYRGTGTSGHYVCVAVGPDGPWTMFDDDWAKGSTIAHATARADRFVPFILYYQRKGD